ncbi:uncharacterized protein LOC131157761 isoform X2 [Malania oleifera]|uniref:uncharacterized protein LOC131157761 isoform X2 n=1 Tax=Malania oleifera TaxID=397392 RepID=UPI0025AE9593|nr:uncharacterized protein LOC131157761 isoform X2 [Malania oleifera]
MSSERHAGVRDLVEEAKKRIVFLVICVVGLSYLMSLTSSSVLINLPAAASLIIILRYLSLDFENRRKAKAYNSKSTSMNIMSQKKHPEGPKVVTKKSDWRRKIDSPVVEEAIDQFTRHLVSEWVTNLWYSRVTPDREGPEELVQIMNGVLGEISDRAKSINLIDLLTRDIINLICTHLELFRASLAKIERQNLGPLTIDQRDTELKLVLNVENKLHPALFSPEAEHKVLQHLMDGLISFTFKPEDLQCSFFRYVARELLACTVIRPVLNLASPRFINERIESLAISATKARKGATTAQEACQSKTNVSSKISSDHFSRFLDPSVTGVELVQLKNDQSKTAESKPATGNVNGMHHSKDPLLSIDAQSTRSWSSLHSDSQTGDGGSIQRHRSGGEWGDMLDIISRRKTQALAPEHFENMWTKGRNYKKTESLIEQVPQNSSPGLSNTADHSMLSKHKGRDGVSNINIPDSSAVLSGCNDQSIGVDMVLHNSQNMSSSSSITSYAEDDEHDLRRLGEVESGSSSSDQTEDEEASIVTGLDSPGTKVWDGRNNRNVPISHIRHPLEISKGHRARRDGKGHVHFQKLSRTQSGRKRSRLSSQKMPVWQEVQRTSFISGDGQDILSSSKGHTVVEDSSDDSEVESWGRAHSGAAASSSAPISLPQGCALDVNSPNNSLLADSFLRLRCEVLGANIVKSGSKTFAVYSISVTDVNNNSWSIKRRFRNFEELHRRLKEFPQYNLHLPPKHFLSTGLDMPVIQERCKLLDKYLKSLLQLPIISGSIEVWDFLSVDSQTYVFSNSISIIETLSVDLDDKPSEKTKQVPDFIGPVSPLSFSGDPRSKESAMQKRHNFVEDGSRLDTKGVTHSSVKKLVNESRKQFEGSDSDSDTKTQKNPSSIRNSGKIVRRRDGEGSKETSELLVDATDPTLPTEWVPPNLSVPILDLVDVIFQVQDGGWIRRKAFWVAKQVLQLGMGDAFDDWLIEKIQLLRRGSVIASGIRRVEKILWPDGIFITKHPKRQQPPPSKQQEEENHMSLEEEQKQEANRRAKFVYELMIENAPAAVVGLVGRKEYVQCAKDLYFFLQSSVCLRLLAYDLLELLLLSALPEMHHVFAQLHEDRHKFGELKIN